MRCSPLTTFPYRMIHHLKLIQLKADLPANRVEEMMVESRIRILKIQDVLSLACGKKMPVTGHKTLADLFLALEFENSLKRTSAFDHPVYQQFEAQILKPNAEKIEVLEFEMDPGKDVRFS
jgi:hypothetical protein